MDDALRVSLSPPSSPRLSRLIGILVPTKVATKVATKVGIIGRFRHCAEDERGYNRGMKKRLFAMSVRRPALLLAGLAMVSAVHADNWPAWRGAEGSGVSAERRVPLSWSPKENVRWKVPLPDRGNSTPIIWEDRVFITQALEKEGRRMVVCFRRVDGLRLWQEGPVYAEPEETHDENPACAASPVTDGKRVFAFFGSAGLFCFDLYGNKVWQRDLGKFHHQWGYAASPMLTADLCILNFGPSDKTFLVALDKKTGETAWRVDVPFVQPEQRTDGFAGREKGGMVGSWSTPLLITANGRPELVMTFPEQVRALDPATGKGLWTCKGLNPLVYASPIYGNGVVVAMGGFLGSSVAVRPGGQGDVTASHRLWQVARTKNRLGSGVIHEDYIYVLDTPGVVECLELKTGRVIWEERLKGLGAKSESWSSMVLVGERIYILNQSGDTMVLRASPHFKVLAVNSIGGEMTNASHAISDGDIFIRTQQNLWCISEKK